MQHQTKIIKYTIEKMSIIYKGCPSDYICHIKNHLTCLFVFIYHIGKQVVL
jgi:hypothetical protein